MSCVRNTLLLLATIIIFCASGLWAGIPIANAATQFNDLQGHWAVKAVSRAAALDLISGYPEGQFKPDQEISQIESVVLFMRAEGFNFDKTTAQKKINPAAVPQQKTPVIPWGQSYLDAAAQNQFLSTDQVAAFNSAAPASRAEIAALLARILHLAVPVQTTDDAVNAKFSDLAECPPTYLPYVLAISDAGLMSGYPDGSFGPNQSIKRSEAAALLSKLIDLGWVKVPAGRKLEGWVKNLSIQKGALEIELVSLQGSQKVKLDTNVQCYKELQNCLPRETLDYQVEVILNKQKAAAVINLLEKRAGGAPDDQITGSIKSIALGEDSILVLNDLDCTDRILPLALDATVDGSGKSASKKGFQSLKPQTFVKVYLTDDKVTRVTVLDTLSISGTIESLSSTRMRFATKTTKVGKPEWFNYYDRARVVDKDGKRIGGVERGDKVKVTYLDPIPGEIDDELPLEIMISSKSKLKKVSGEVQSIEGSEGAYQITLKKDKINNLDTNAKVYLTGEIESTFSAIRVGDKVELQVDGAGVAMSVTIVLKTVSGEVQSTGGTAGAYQITLVQDEVYQIDPTALIYQPDGTTTTFDTIQEGDTVDLGVDGTGIVMTLSITAAADS